jgi:hypothetical protein
MGNVAIDVIVMICNADIVRANRLRKGNDFADGVVARIFAVSGVEMKVPFEPEPVADAGNGRQRASVYRRPGIAVARLGKHHRRRPDRAPQRCECS